MIPSPFHSSRGGDRVRLIVVHTAEGARTVESLGAWFQNPAAQVSSHAGIDDFRVETYVPYERAAWTTRAANSISDNVELCGWAKWTRQEWLAHQSMLDYTATWIRLRCTARGIPLRKLTPAQVAAGMAGVIGHVDWTLGMNDGTHLDPGLGFPWDVVMARAGGESPTSGIYCQYGDRSNNVLKLQRFMTTYFPSYNPYTPTGYYGDATAAGVLEFQRRTKVTNADGSPPDGRTVGERTMAQLLTYGFRP